MKATWSKNIHTPDFLFRHRSWRFDDKNKDLFIKYLAFNEGGRIIELGCGPGVLCGKIKKWFPSSKVIGIDNDAEFINFAKRKIRGCNFIKMDIRDAVLEPADYIISHTIMEYFDPEAFFHCQNRLLRSEGHAVIISVVPDSRRNAILWNPNFYKKPSNDSPCNNSTSHLISRQGYNDETIVSLFHSFNFEIEEINYLPIITMVDKLDACKQKEYREMIESYQINRMTTSSASNNVEYLQDMYEYYDAIFKEIDRIKPADLEILRIIKAKKTASAHSYC